MPYSRGSSWPRDQTHITCISGIGRQILYHCTTWEAPYGIRECFNFILLHIAGQFSQILLIEEIFFSPLHILASFVIEQMTISVLVYLWALYSVPLINVFVPVPYHFDYYSFVVLSKVKECDSLAVFFFKIILVIQSLLHISTNSRNICSSSVKNAFGISIGIVLNLQTA